jgi:hypothetical protein
MTPQEMKIISDRRRAYKAGATPATSYSDVGTGDASTIKGWSDLTPTEAAYIKNNRLYRNQKFNRTDDVNGPLSSNDTTVIGMFRSGTSTIQNNIAKGDFTVAGPNPGSITIEESTEFMSARNTQGIEGDVPMTPEEIQKISDRRRAFVSTKPAPATVTPSNNVVPAIVRPSIVPSSYPLLTAPASLTLTPDETDAVLKMRKAAAIQEARVLLAQEDDYSTQYSQTSKRYSEHRNYERGDDNNSRQHRHPERTCNKCGDQCGDQCDDQSGDHCEDQCGDHCGHPDY